MTAALLTALFSHHGTADARRDELDEFYQFISEVPEVASEVAVDVYLRTGVELLPVRELLVALKARQTMGLEMETEDFLLMKVSYRACVAVVRRPYE